MTARGDRVWYVADRFCLGDPEHLAATVVVGPDGSQRWSITEPGHRCDDCPLPDPPEHEHTGPLPADVADRAGRCNAPTSYPRAGSLCSNRSKPVYGGRCGWHRKAVR